MKNQKGFVIPLIIAIVVIMVIGGGIFVYENKKVEAPIVPQIIGGDKDEHGCLGPAGYSWCEIKDKCLRVWEEKCEADEATTTNPVACTADAMQCPDGSWVGRSAPDCKFICPSN